MTLLRSHDSLQSAFCLAHKSRTSNGIRKEKERSLFAAHRISILIKGNPYTCCHTRKWNHVHNSMNKSIMFSVLSDCYTTWWFTYYTWFGLPYLELKVVLKGAWSLLLFIIDLALAETVQLSDFQRSCDPLQHTMYNVHRLPIATNWAYSMWKSLKIWFK